METWKQEQGLLSCFGSYRTYEEWKHYRKEGLSYWKIGSYRTYEEWKLYLIELVKLLQKVLTVPMRNGNTPTASA